jgi:hypothetical protein
MVTVVCRTYVAFSEGVSCASCHSGWECSFSALGEGAEEPSGRVCVRLASFQIPAMKYDK